MISDIEHSILIKTAPNPESFGECLKILERKKENAKRFMAIPLDAQDAMIAHYHAIAGASEDFITKQLPLDSKHQNDPDYKPNNHIEGLPDFSELVFDSEEVLRTHGILANLILENEAKFMEVESSVSPIKKDADKAKYKYIDLKHKTKWCSDE